VCYQVDSGKPLVKVEGEEGAQGSGEPGEAMEVNISFPDQLKKTFRVRVADPHSFHLDPDPAF
jgi:hypothetical protein